MNDKKDQWIIVIKSVELTDKQKRLLKNYLDRKKIKHYGWME